MKTKSKAKKVVEPKVVEPKAKKVVEPKAKKVVEPKVVEPKVKKAVEQKVKTQKEYSYVVLEENDSTISVEFTAPDGVVHNKVLANVQEDKLKEILENQLRGFKHKHINGTL